MTEDTTKYGTGQVREPTTFSCLGLRRDLLCNLPATAGVMAGRASRLGRPYLATQPSIGTQSGDVGDLLEVAQKAYTKQHEPSLGLFSGSRIDHLRRLEEDVPPAQTLLAQSVEKGSP